MADAVALLDGRPASNYRGEDVSDIKNIMGTLIRFSVLSGEQTHEPAYRQPWYHDGRWWATNGHILVSVVYPQGPAGPVPKKAEEIARLFAKNPGATWKAIADAPAVTYSTGCDDCNSSGTLPKRCAVCHGSGEHKCDDCETYHGCEPCGGTGERPNGGTQCPTCRGVGKHGSVTYHGGLGPCIQLSYADLLGKLGAEVSFPDQDMAPIPFRFAAHDLEFRGLVMPRRGSGACRTAEAVRPGGAA